MERSRKTTYIIRDAEPGDLPAMRDIYAWYVENTAISFEYETPSEEEFAGRMMAVQQRYPWLIAADGDHILGYAYACAFHPRAAYGWCAELAIYLDRQAKGCGIGRTLYEALEDRLKGMGVLNLYACIGVPDQDDEYLTDNSEQFHRHMGFETIGTFHHCGYKFGRWYNMIWMEKIIGEHLAVQSPVKAIAAYKGDR